MIILVLSSNRSPAFLVERMGRAVGEPALIGVGLGLGRRNVGQEELIVFCGEGVNSVSWRLLF